jgi:Na+-translocating ferredoxin:NAD+ oxidoreductase RnfE subunit
MMFPKSQHRVRSLKLKVYTLGVKRRLLGFTAMFCGIERLFGAETTAIAAMISRIKEPLIVVFVIGTRS